MAMLIWISFYDPRAITFSFSSAASSSPNFHYNNLASPQTSNATQIGHPKPGQV
jgi:hypothetical protein